MPTLFEHYMSRRTARIKPVRAIDAFQQARGDFARGRELQERRKTYLDHGDVIRARIDGKRRTFVICIADDDDISPPWERAEGHGDVSDWTTRDKLPGELVLNEERGSKRYYDFAAACRTARADGWNAPPYDVPGETPRQKAARAAMADYEFLRTWCNDQWRYVGVCLFELPHDGQYRDASAIADAQAFGDLEHRALWGIESNCEDYIDEVARELIAEF